MAGSGDGDVAEAGVEQVWVDAGIGVDEDAFGREALGAVTGDGVAVVEMTMLTGIEVDLAVVVEAGQNTTLRLNRLDHSHVTIGNAERFVRRGELDSVTYREFAVDFLVDADTREAAGIIGGKFLVRFLDCKQVCGWINRDDRCVGGGSDADGFAATCVTNYIVDLVVACP